MLMNCTWSANSCTANDFLLQNNSALLETRHAQVSLGKIEKKRLYHLATLPISRSPLCHAIFSKLSRRYMLENSNTKLKACLPQALDLIYKHNPQ